MNCRDFHEIIDSYLSDELLTETNHGILSHLEQCGECRNEIEARRAIRGRLKNAVLSSPDYRPDSEFLTLLESELRRTAINGSGGKPYLWFFQNSWIAAAAGLLLVLTVGFILFNRSQPVNDRAGLGETPAVTGLRSSSLVNVALGDHQHCAIRFNLDDPPVSLVKASAKYKDLDKIVVPPLKRVLSQFELIEAHACKYKETSFAHIVFTDGEKTLSVLLTEYNGNEEAKSGEIFDFSSVNPKYQIARFNTREYAVFVVSDLDREQNKLASRALSDPLKHYFENQSQIASVLLTII